MCTSMDLLRLMTRKHNAFLRKNLTVTLTTDRFSATNVPMGSDAGFLSPDAVGLQSVNGKEVTLVRQSRKRRVCKNSKRRGAGVTTYTTETVDVSKVGRRNRLMNRRASRLRAVARKLNSSQ